MKLYLLEQNLNNTWDTFDSCLVVAPNEDIARTIHPYTNPNGYCYSKSKTIIEHNELNWNNEDRYYDRTRKGDSWVKRSLRSRIKVTYIGEADSKYTEPQCIIASYNAG